MDSLQFQLFDETMSRIGRKLPIFAVYIKILGIKVDHDAEQKVQRHDKFFDQPET